jgi:hypothetical protein
MSCTKPAKTYVEQLDAKFLPYMGFPADWQQRPLWKQLIPPK